jgi:hypothetical protein
MATIKFSNTISPKNHFGALTKAPYASNIEPIAELIDNSIAANATEIRTQLDFDGLKMGSIEDNGKGFPTSSEELYRCFTYGNNDENTSELNEHGCGLKSSLSVLDKSDKNWRCYWKNNNQVYRLKSSFTSDEHEVVKGGTWNGEMTSPGGVLINFPIDKQGFADLYCSNKAKMETSDLMARIRMDFAHRWMLHPKVMSGRVKLFLNGDYIEPYVFSLDVCDKTDKASVKLAAGADVQIGIYMVTKQNENSWFKKTRASAGFYVYKNGRFIQSFLGGAPYERLYGAKPHPEHIGFICLINVTGSQKVCPPTIPTKNGLDLKHPITDDLFEKVHSNVTRFLGKKQGPSEENLFTTFLRNRRTHYSDDNPIILEKKMLYIPDYDTKTPQLDGYEINGNKGIIYEAKKANQPSLDDINQLFANWIYACLAKEFSGKTIKPVLIIDAIQKSFKMTDDHKNKIKILNSKVKFPLEIWNYEGEKLFKMD